MPKLMTLLWMRWLPVRSVQHWRGEHSRYAHFAFRTYQADTMRCRGGFNDNGVDGT